MRIRSILLSILITTMIVITVGQGCSNNTRFSLEQTLGLNLQNISGSNSDNNGTGYGGKLLVLHHYVEGFTCEGKSRPESILIRNASFQWVRIQHQPDRCFFINREPVSTVVYDATTNEAQYDGQRFIPPKEYFVIASEDPNRPGINLDAGVCEDAAGVCSLRAAVEQASVTSLTEPVVVHVPAGIYNITSSIVLSGPYDYAQSVTIRGENKLTTVFDGMNLMPPLSIDRISTSLVSVQNITFQNGSGPAGPNMSSAIQFPWTSKSSVDIFGCIFKNNKTYHALYVPWLLNSLSVRNSIFQGNSKSMYVWRTKNVLIEDTWIDSNGEGLALIEVSSATIRRSTISNNTATGLGAFNCDNCLIENSTIVNNQTGLTITVGVTPAPLSEFVVRNSTIVNNNVNGNLQGGHPNLFLMANAGPSLKLNLSNTIVATNDATKVNCGLLGSISVQSTNNLFDDATCSFAGPKDFSGAPLLGALQNNGGLTLTMKPTALSPAIDSGANAFCPLADQTSAKRPMDHLGAGAVCDIGAFEVQ